MRLEFELKKRVWESRRATNKEHTDGDAGETVSRQRIFLPIGVGSFFSGGRGNIKGET